MEMSKYIKRYVRIDLKNGYYYSGYVLGCDEQFISIKDKLGKLVDISIDSISYIREEER